MGCRMANGRALAALFLLVSPAAICAEINVIALTGGTAVLTVDGGKPRTLKIGETSVEGVKLLAATSELALVEYQGARQTLTIGGGTRIVRPAAPARGRIVLTADARGHYFANGAINGNAVRFLVDTGATTVVLSRAEAKRLGLDYLKAPHAYSQTANGVVAAYRVKLDTVQLGDIVLYNVDAIVSEGEGLPLALLGMSFLNRTDMIRDGASLVLTKRY